jgi:diguanylate cyclase (GGDEF)-like protein
MTSFRLRPIQYTVLAVVALFLIAVAALSASLVWKLREDALSNSSIQASRFISSAVASLNRTMLGVDVLLASLDESLTLAEHEANEIDSHVASQMLHSIAGRNLLLRRLVLLDPQGKVLASSDVDAFNRLEVPAEFLNRVLNKRVSALTLSSPLRQDNSGEPVLLLARSLKLADGSRVAAIAEVLVSQVSTIMVQGADIPGLEVTLERQSGELLAAQPDQDKLLGSTLPDPVHDDLNKTQFRAARLTGQDATVSWQSILYDDILVVASIPNETTLAAWRHERRLVALAALIFAAMVLSTGAISIWYLERLAQAQQTIKRSKDEIEHLAFYDHLTNLPNRLLLMDRLTHALSSSQRTKYHGVMLFLDLDNFKAINDTQGHDVGDQLLQQVAKRLSVHVRTNDTVARLGGDEFVVLLENLSKNPIEAAELAKRVGKNLITQLAQPYFLSEQSHRSSASVGAALFGADSGSAADLLKQADIAMYRVKELGRNNLCFFDPQMQADINAHATLEADLQIAVVEQQFLLYYQAQVDQSCRVIGAEVLIRWLHPQRGLVSPFSFIPVAEESDVINAIGLWVLKTACQQLANWQQSTTTAYLQLAVNVSARQFRQADFVDVVKEVILQTGIQPQGLKLELTESLVLDNIDDTIAKMASLKCLGVRFSMDDFGTGQSSLSYLTRLPLDQVKIDQSFVRNIGIKPSDGMIVQTIIGMAKNLGLEVIAEGVETSSQQAFLADHGCSLYQGYLFGRPCPLAEFQNLLQNTLNPA